MPETVTYGVRNRVEPGGPANPRNPLVSRSRADSRAQAPKGALPRSVKLIFAVVFVYLFASFCVQEVNVLSLAAQVRDLEHQTERLEAENARLLDDINFARTDAYIERVAREELGLVWPNEIPYASGERTGARAGGEAGG